MAKDLRLKLAGQNRRLRYTLAERYDIERVANAASPNAGYLRDILFSGKLLEQAVVVWAGVKGADPGYKITPRGVIEAFQRHQDEGGDYYQELYCPAAMLACECGLLGKFDADELKRLLGYEEPKGKEEADDEVEAPPASVRAAE